MSLNKENMFLDTHASTEAEGKEKRGKRSAENFLLFYYLLLSSNTLFTLRNLNLREESKGSA